MYRGAIWYVAVRYSFEVAESDREMAGRDPEELLPLSPAVFHILLALADAERHGYGIIKEVEARTEGRVRRREGPATLARLWGEAVLDLALNVPREHLERLGKGGGLMKTLRTAALAAVAYAFTLLVVAPLYARNVGSLPSFAASLIDALIATGLVFNFVYLLLTLTRWREGVRAVRAALVVTALVVAGLITLMVVGSGSPAHVNLNVVVAQILSLLFWFTAHLWWVRRKGGAVPHPTAE